MGDGWAALTGRRQGVLEARLREVHEGRLAPGQRGFYELYRSVVAHPHWLVPGSLHRDRSINTLFTFSRNERDRGILPVFSSRPEFAKFLQLMRTSAAASPGYQSECFEMPGHLLFAQLALAVHRTNLERVVVDITVAPSFSIAKDKLDTWREWADVISCTFAPISRLLLLLHHLLLLLTLAAFQWSRFCPARRRRRPGAAGGAWSRSAR